MCFKQYAMIVFLTADDIPLIEMQVVYGNDYVVVWNEYYAFLGQKCKEGKPRNTDLHDQQ